MYIKHLFLFNTKIHVKIFLPLVRIDIPESLGERVAGDLQLSYLFKLYFVIIQSTEKTFDLKYGNQLES